MLLSCNERNDDWKIIYKNPLNIFSSLLKAKEKLMSRRKILHRWDVKVRFRRNERTKGTFTNFLWAKTGDSRLSQVQRVWLLPPALLSDFDRNSKQTSANFRCREGTKYRLKLLRLCYVQKTMRIKNSEVTFRYVMQKKKKNGWCVLSKGCVYFDVQHVDCHDCHQLDC